MLPPFLFPASALVCTDMASPPFSLMIHGGAGKQPDEATTSASLLAVLSEVREMLDGGASALDAVERAVALLEDDPLYNAGRGSVLNEEGEVEMDASIMEGAELRAGAVAGVTLVKNPVRLARLVMEKSEHVLLIGRGAEAFGKRTGAQFAPREYFILPHREAQLKEAQKADKIVLDHGDVLTERKFGTVGAVARDRAGTLAAATSTGGIVNKRFGRVGDTPLIGCGTYADNETCAVSATGFGEQFIRTAMAKATSDLVAFQSLSAQAAADEAVAYLVRKVKGLGGLIVVDASGRLGAAHSTPGLVHGYLDERGECVAAFGSAR